MSGAVLLYAVSLAWSAAASPTVVVADDGRLQITTTDGPQGRTSRGTYRVYEDRSAGSGRTLDLQVVVLHARRDDPRPDPIVFLAGGPGQNAAAIAPGFAGHWMRRDRDMVFVSQRGTGGEHRLDVSLAGNDDDLQSYLDPIFDVERFRRGMEVLSRRADLTMYSTPTAMDDLDEVLTALGYGDVNLVGGSYGTRASLVFLRRHGARVRSAILNGVAPIAFKNPLYHARAAQRGIERIFEEVEANPTWRRVFPDLRGRFGEILARLDREPASVRVRHPGRRIREETVTLDRDDFCEALRVLMYYTPTNRQVPRLLMRAWEGDFTEIAQRGLESNRGLRRSLAFGMLMCITAAEDLARIDEREIVAATDGTFLGDIRVRSQMAVGEIWPKSDLPDGYGEPVSVEVPVLILSGTHDPVTPPEWGEVAHRHLSNSVHVVVPGAHGVSVPSIERQFLERASVAELDVTPARDVRLPPFVFDV